MLIVISPAKTLDYETPVKTRKFTQPDFLDQSQRLIDILKTKSAPKLEKLMNISGDLAELNRGRYSDWHTPFTPDNSKQAVLAFKGDVYAGLEADTFSSRDIDWAQKHLRILSGLYGLLRPLDLMQPYRLEMGTSLKSRRGKNLYQFWDTQISEALNSQLESINSRTLVNLASNEYFKSVKPKLINGDVVTPAFRDWNNGEYKMIGFFAKKARGTMSAWIIKNRVKKTADLVSFDLDGYRYDQASSSARAPVFLRKQ